MALTKEQQAKLAQGRAMVANFKKYVNKYYPLILEQIAAADFDGDDMSDETIEKASQWHSAIERMLRDAWRVLHTPEGHNPDGPYIDTGWLADWNDDEIIGCVNGEHWRVGYRLEGVNVIFSERDNWQAVAPKQEWVAKAVDFATESESNHLKALAVTDTQIIAGNYIILWGDEDRRDLEGHFSKHVNSDGSKGQWFTPTTELESDYTKSGVLHIDWEHARDPDETGVGGDDIFGTVNWKTARFDENGVFVQRALNRHKQYSRAVKTLLDAGVLGTSSEPIQKGVEIAPTGEILKWPLKRDTLTVTPMEWRMKSDNVLQAMKALSAEFPHLKSAFDTNTTSPEDDSLEAAKKAATDVSTANGANEADESQDNSKSSQMETNLMGLEVTQEAWNTLNGKIDVLVKAMNMSDNDGDLGFAGGGEDSKPQNHAKAFHFNRMVGVGNDVQKASRQVKAAIYKDIAKSVTTRWKDGTSDIRQLDWVQQKALRLYMYHGSTKQLSPQEELSLKSMVFPELIVDQFLADGRSVDDILKAQQAAIDELGGHVLPPTMQQGILVERAKISQVLRLVTTIVLTGTTATYFVKLVERPRGTWGEETQNLGADGKETGFKLAAQKIDLHTFNAYVDVSRTLLMNAVGISGLVTGQFAEASGEALEREILIGDGIAKPHGIFPNNKNAHNLNLTYSGNADKLTTRGVKRIKRGIRSVYRQNASYVFSDDASFEVEELVTPAGDYVFQVTPALDNGHIGGRFYNLRGSESEHLPDVAAESTPIFYGDFSGYKHVTQGGMVIERFHDSGTGTNMYRYELRSREGGDLVELYKMSGHRVGVEA